MRVDLAEPVVVTAVRCRILEAAIDERITMSFGALTARRMALIEVESSDGAVGYGESWINYPSWAHAERVATVRDGIAPLLVGADVRDLGQVHARLLDALEPLGRQWGAPGPIRQAISGVDMALWDLLGRVSGRSVSTLLGRRRGSVEVYASSIDHGDPQAVADNCRERGFTAVKVKLGQDPATDRATLAASRSALGPDAHLFADANQAWDLAQAVDSAGMLNDCGVEWIEEPVRHNSVADLDALADRTGLRCATGENVYGSRGFQPYLASPGVHVIQPDVSKSGGLTEVFAICLAALDAGKVVIPHVYGGALAYAATLQLAAALRGITMVEFDVRSNPLRDDLLCATPLPHRGIAEIPDGAGLGVDVDARAVRRWEVNGR